MNVPLQMEKQINDTIRHFFIDFKKEIIQKRIDLNIDEFNEYVAEKPTLEISLKDFQRKPKTAPNTRCIAFRTNGDQCTRKKQTGKEYCTTHSKTLLGKVVPPNTPTSPNATTTEICLENFDGIYYYVDKHGHMYKTEDIREGKIEPFAKYSRTENGRFTIVEI